MPACPNQRHTRRQTITRRSGLSAPPRDALLDDSVFKSLTTYLHQLTQSTSGTCFFNSSKKVPKSGSKPKAFANDMYTSTTFSVASRTEFHTEPHHPPSVSGTSAGGVSLFFSSAIPHTMRRKERKKDFLPKERAREMRRRTWTWMLLPRAGSMHLT